MAGWLADHHFRFDYVESLSAKSLRGQLGIFDIHFWEVRIYLILPEGSGAENLRFPPGYILFRTGTSQEWRQ